MQKRIFVALKISDELQRQIGDWRKQYNTLPVRWTAAKNLHVTLLPPWYTDDTETIKTQLRKLQGHSGSFPMVFEKISLGPNIQEARYIWAEGKTPEKLLNLKKELEQICGQKPTKKSFRLHLTLARLNPLDLKKIAGHHPNEKIEWSQNADSMVLMESHLGPQGADYEILETIAL